MAGSSPQIASDLSFTSFPFNDQLGEDDETTRESGGLRGFISKYVPGIGLSTGANEESKKSASPPPPPPLPVDNLSIQNGANQRGSANEAQGFLTISMFSPLHIAF